MTKSACADLTDILSLLESGSIDKNDKIDKFVDSNESLEIDKLLEKNEQRRNLGRRPTLSMFCRDFGERPVIKSDKDLINIEKNTIFVLDNKGTCFPVSWSKDKHDADAIRESLLCACMSIANENIRLRRLEELTVEEFDELIAKGEDKPTGLLIEVILNGNKKYFAKGPIYDYEDFSKVQNLELFLIEKSYQRDDLSYSISNNLERKNLVELDVLEHIEAQKAIAQLSKGTNLLKHCTFDFPHFRYFIVSRDLKKLKWITTSMFSRAYIEFKSIREIKIGFPTSDDVFFGFKNLTFSLLYDNAFLTITCQSGEIFNTWLTGIKALTYYNKNLPVNKIDLLNHVVHPDESLIYDDVLISNFFESRIISKIDANNALQFLNKEEAKITARIDSFNNAHNNAKFHLNQSNDSDTNNFASSAEDTEILYREDFELEKELLLSIFNSFKQKKMEIQTILESNVDNDSFDYPMIEKKIFSCKIDVENLYDLLERLTKGHTNYTLMLDKMICSFKKIFQV